MVCKRLRWMAAFVLTGALVLSFAHAQDLSLLPKYGGQSKTDQQRAADAKLFAEMDARFAGDRRKAAGEAASRGWASLRQGDPADAMRRFNQAWLLDPRSGVALWGMGAVQGGKGDLSAAMQLFQEAEPHMGADIDFAVDHARTIGMAAAESNDAALLRDALARFERLHARAPAHTLNLQNWAITLFHAGNYPEAWKKVKLAEATGRRDAIDPAFVAALQAKMPRPR